MQMVSLVLLAHLVLVVAMVMLALLVPVVLLALLVLLVHLVVDLTWASWLHQLKRRPLILSVSTTELMMPM